MTVDPFDEIVKGIEIEATDPILYSEYSKHKLLVEFSRIKKILNDRGTLLNPITEQDQDLHAQYHGLLLEMRKRGMK